MNILQNVSHDRLCGAYQHRIQSFICRAVPTPTTPSSCDVSWKGSYEVLVRGDMVIATRRKFQTRYVLPDTCSPSTLKPAVGRIMPQRTSASSAVVSKPVCNFSGFIHRLERIPCRAGNVWWVLTVCRQHYLEVLRLVVVTWTWEDEAMQIGRRPDRRR